LRELRSGAPKLSRAPAYIGAAFIKQEILENPGMEKNDFEDKWKQIRSHSKIWWDLITDSDLIKVDQAEIKYFEFVTRLQLRYKLDRQVAKDMIDRRAAEHEAGLKSITT
jgi:hypothetical protein